MAELYNLERLGCFPVTKEMRRKNGEFPGMDGVHEYWEVVQRFGPMTKREAQNRSRAIYAETKDRVNIYRADTGRQVASVAWNGELYLEYEYDSEGNKLPIDDANNFWSDAEPLPGEN